MTAVKKVILLIAYGRTRVFRGCPKIREGGCEMDCSEFSRMLDSYADLDKFQIAELDIHAAQCEKCRAELEFFRLITKTTASLEAPSPPSDLKDRINSEIDKMPKQSFIKTVTDNIKVNIRQYATLAACLVLGIVVGVNGQMMSRRISGGDNDGVIRRQTMASDRGEEPGTNDMSEGAVSDGETSAAEGETDAQAAQSSDTKAQGETSAVSGRGAVSSSAGVSASARDTAEREPAAVSGNGSNARSVSNVSSRGSQSTETASQPVVDGGADTKAVESVVSGNSVSPAQESILPVSGTEDAAAEQHAAATDVSEGDNGSYTIPHDTYHMPEQNGNENSVASSESGEVENYSLAQSEEDEYGYNTKAREENPDRLAVYSDDAERVLTILGEFHVESSSLASSMASSDFYAFLSRLDAEGIDYSYQERGGSGDHIIFRIALL